MFHSIFSLLDNFVSSMQTLLYIDVVQPILFKVGLMGYDEDTYDALYWVIVGVLEVCVMYAVLRPIEALRPAEKWADRKGVRVDVLYTWIVKLGILNLFFFFAFQPFFDGFQSWLRLHNIANMDLDNLWPGVTSQPLVAFIIYVVVLDFAGYWYHRMEHRIGIWWELHAVHHSQQKMSLWSDDRNHLLDDIMQAGFFAAVALVIGVQPSQFVVLVAITNLMQSVQHANIRIHFGWLGERLLVSPTFHRRHHAIGFGHEGTTYGCNFGVLFPWWDVIFRSVSWNRDLEPTGIRDQLPVDETPGRNYGSGFFEQHWLAFGRIRERFAAHRATSAPDPDSDATTV